jgi:hypothetical protein
MREDSATFTADDLGRFFAEMVPWEITSMAERLKRASDRLLELGQRVAEEPPGTAGWNAKEVLAHIAVLSRAYGVFGYMVATGRLTDLPLEGVITQRDAEGAKYMQMPAADIVAEAVNQHQRTLKFLEGMTPEQFRRTVTTESGELSVDYILRMPLLAHLEQHLDQLQRALP